MKNTRLIPLALTAALSLSLLAGCGGSEAPAPTATPAPVVTEAPVPEATQAPAATEAPEATEAPAVTEAPEATEAPAETPAPEATEAPAPEETAAPEATPAPTAAPAPTPAPTATPAPTPAPTAAPAPTPAPTPAPSAVKAIWNGISGLDIPALSELDGDMLYTLYGIDQADLVDYVCAMPLMNVQATEFFVAQVKDGKMNAVKQGALKRQADLEQEWSQYLPEQLELVQNYRLETKGNYIIFAISDCADDAVSIFNANAK